MSLHLQTVKVVFVVSVFGTEKGNSRIWSGHLVYVSKYLLVLMDFTTCPEIVSYVYEEPARHKFEQVTHFLHKDFFQSDYSGRPSWGPNIRFRMVEVVANMSLSDTHSLTQTIYGNIAGSCHRV